MKIPFICYGHTKSSRPEAFCKEGNLENFTKFSCTGVSI